ncbi:leucine rich adaptor protein 1-like [Chanos chanos]|uniref:Leucine rich adaptor protein 1-like n=1 Tax=Chanos chanos TaxID=29144 RepID=A0A6J2W0H1_CHACN|nr:leucine rich adaptor protein 1-like [Chanos chanos]
MEEDNHLPNFKDLETKLGRKVPESLVRSLTDGDFKWKSDTKSTENHSASNDVKRLESKMLFLKQEMALLRAIDVKLMHQLLSINEGIESIRWVMEDRASVASHGSSLTGSLYSLSDSQDASQGGSCSSLHDGSDGLDGISVGSYLDMLGGSSPNDLSDSFTEKSMYEEDAFKKNSTRPRVDTDEYYCFG